MSGGIAYVYDEDGQFAKRCNTEMVNLREVEQSDEDVPHGRRPEQRGRSVEDFGMGDPLYYDSARIRILLERHVLHTGSSRAKAILDDFDNAVGKFVKVMPRDYENALKMLESERLEAESVAAE